MSTGPSYRKALVPNEFDEWNIYLTAPSDRFDLVMTTDIAAGRFIDAVVIEPIDEPPEGGLLTAF